MRSEPGGQGTLLGEFVDRAASGNKKKILCALQGKAVPAGFSETDRPIFSVHCDEIAA
jgi:hypothetical protein